MTVDLETTTSLEARVKQTRPTLRGMDEAPFSEKPTGWSAARECQSDPTDDSTHREAPCQNQPFRLYHIEYKSG